MYLLNGKFKYAFPCSLKLSSGEQCSFSPSGFAIPRGWEWCALVQVQYKLLVFYVPVGSCDSNKGECEGLGLIWLLNQSVKSPLSATYFYGS